MSTKTRVKEFVLPHKINPIQRLKERMNQTLRVSTVKAISRSFLKDSSNTESDCHKNNQSTTNQTSENSNTQNKVSVISNQTTTILKNLQTPF
jgi:hypothetical protein